MRTVHVITNRLYPSPGGLERSVLTIADMLAELPSTNVQVYTRAPEYAKNGRAFDGVRHPICHLADGVLQITQQSGDADLPSEEQYRLNAAVLRNAIHDSMLLRPVDSHVILSFFASTTGLIAQRVAEDLGCPHIATVRGSDYSVGSYAPQYLHALEYVCRRASAVVTTNDSQLRAIRASFDRATLMRTIYNPIPFQRRQRRRPTRLTIFTDTGLSVKKGSHVLLQAFRRILCEWPSAQLLIAGEIESGEASKWHDVIDNQGPVQLLGHVEEAELFRLLTDAAVYASATLSEGCSNARIRAVSAMVPMATTHTGELLDRGTLPHVFACRPGDVTAFATALADAIRYHESGELPDADQVREWLEPMHPRLVRNAWEVVLNAVSPKYENVVRKVQPRVLLFSHDGTGIGHLRRLARIAGALQGPCACLVVTGHTAAGWLVPEHCEHVHLPNLDSLIASRSRYWGREPFLKLPMEEAKAFRQQLLTSVIQWYRPDALFVDFLPLGKNRELADVVQHYPCKKYFVLRGILDDPRNVRVDVLGGNGEQSLEDHYDRIFVTTDKRIVDVATEYELSEKIKQKLVYTGYVAPESSVEARRATRARRGIQPGARWIVCSAGGGKLGERLIEECIRIARSRDDLMFDVVLGPRSALRSEVSTYDDGRGRLRIVEYSAELPEYHAAADVVVCPGGYNSMLEVISGQAELICVPVQLDTDDEQFIHVQRLSEYYRMQLVTAPYKIAAAIDEALSACGTSPLLTPNTPLNLDGTTAVRNQVFDDFGLAAYL